MIINEDFFDDVESEDIVNSEVDNEVEDSNQYSTEFVLSFYPTGDFQVCYFDEFTTKLAPKIHKRVKHIFDSNNCIIDCSEPEYYCWYDKTDAVTTVNGYKLHYKTGCEYLGSLYVDVKANCRFRNIKQILRFISSINTIRIADCPILSIHIVEPETRNILNTQVMTNLVNTKYWNNARSKQGLYGFVKALLPETTYEYQKLREIFTDDKTDDSDFKYISSYVMDDLKKKVHKIVPKGKDMENVSGRFIDTFKCIEGRVHFSAVLEPLMIYENEFSDDWAYSERADFFRKFCYSKTPEVKVLIKTADNYTGSNLREMRFLYVFDKTEYVEENGEQVEADFFIYTDMDEYAINRAGVDAKELASYLTPLYYLEVDIPKLLPKIGKAFSYEFAQVTVNQIMYHIQQNIRHM